MSSTRRNKLGRTRTKSSSSGNENLADSVDSLEARMQASTESLGRVKTATSSQSGDSPHGLRRAFTSATSLVFSPSSRSRAGSRAASSSGLSDLENFERRGDGFEDYDTSQIPDDYRATIEEAHLRELRKRRGEESPPVMERVPKSTAKYVPGTTEPLLPWGHEGAPRSKPASSRNRSSSSVPRGSGHRRQSKGTVSPPSVMRQRGGAEAGNLSDIED